MLICGNVERPRVSIGLADFRRPMRASVQLENAVVEVFDAEAQARDAEPPDHRQLALGQRARLALEGDLFGLVPRRHRAQALHQPLELLRRQKRRRAAAEVHEVQRPPGNRRQLAVQLELARQHVEVLIDLARVLVGVDAEVAEVTPLAAERNVQVDAERHVRSRAATRAPASRRRRPRPCDQTENGG